jgi:hypothetical protein
MRLTQLVRVVLLQVGCVRSKRGRTGGLVYWAGLVVFEVLFLLVRGGLVRRHVVFLLHGAGAARHAVLPGNWDGRLAGTPVPFV